MMTRTYERVATKLLEGNSKLQKPYCHFDGVKLHTGTASLHKSAKARVWRMFWRLKLNRD